MSNNRVVHFEIPANEAKALTNFYNELFGWKFQLVGCGRRHHGSGREYLRSLGADEEVDSALRRTDR